MGRRPKGYWKNFENVEAELRPICEELGRFPSTNELSDRGKSSLAKYGVFKHGGVDVVAEHMGFPTYDHVHQRHERNYWNFDNTVIEYVKFIKEKNLTRLPTKKDFKSPSAINLIHAVYRHGSKNICEDSRIKSLGLIKKRPKSKWTNEKIVQELTEIMEQLGYFPSTTTLDQMGRSDLRGAITKNGGPRKYWRLLGRPKYKDRKIIDPKIAENPDAVISAFKKLGKKLGHAPTYSDMERLELTWLWRAINNLFGSLHELYQALGGDVSDYGLIRTRDGHIVRSMNEAIVDNILSYLSIPHQTEGRIDDSSDRQFDFDFLLKDLDDNDVYVEVWGYYEKNKPGAMSKIIKAYLERKRAKENFYQERKVRYFGIDGEIFNGSIRSIFKKIYEILLENRIIQDDTIFADNVGIELLVYNVYDIEALVQELRIIENDIGYLPSYHELETLGHTSIAERVMKIGGFPYVRSQYDFKSKPKDLKWTKEKIKTELLPLIEKYGHIPSQGELQLEGRFDLQGAIQRNGGAKKLSAAFGFDIPRPTNVHDFDNLETIRTSLEPLLTSEGKIPPLSVIKSSGISGLLSAIQKFGGRVELAIALGVELSYPAYKNRKYTAWVTERVAAKYGYLPPIKILKQLGYDSLRQAIDRDFGGIAIFAKELGIEYRPDRKRRGPAR